MQGEEATVASDVYAFGITLFEIFTRQEPFEGQNFRDVLTKLIDSATPEVEARPVLPSDIPRNISDTIRKCWAQLPTRRPTFRELLNWISEIGIADADNANSSVGVGRTRLISSKADDKGRAKALYERFPKQMAEALISGRMPEPTKCDCASIFSAQIEGFAEISQVKTRAPPACAQGHANFLSSSGMPGMCRLRALHTPFKRPHSRVPGNIETVLRLMLEGFSSVGVATSR